MVVRSSSNGTNGLSSRFIVAISFLIVVFTLSITFLCVYRYAYFARRYEIQRKDFDEAVASAIESTTFSLLSFLTNSPPAASASDSGSSPVFPTVVQADYAFWEDVRGVSYCRLKGSDFRKGDISPIGIILSINPYRIICRNSSGLVFVRNQSPAEAGMAATTEQPPAPPGDDSATHVDDVTWL